MARIIVRYSMQAGDRQRRGNVRKHLEAAGFSRIGTATFEARDGDLPALLDVVKDVLDIVGSGRLDNLWIYVDQPGEFVD